MQLNPTQRALYNQLREVMRQVGRIHAIPETSRCEDDGDVVSMTSGPLSLSFTRDAGAQWYKEGGYNTDFLNQYLKELRGVKGIDEQILLGFEEVLQTFMLKFEPIAREIETTVMVHRSMSHSVPLASGYGINIRPLGCTDPWMAYLQVRLPETLARSLV